jgi:hypothetical protein
MEAFRNMLSTRAFAIGEDGMAVVAAGESAFEDAQPQLQSLV